MSPAFVNEWVDHMRKVAGKDFFIVGEYWAPGNLPDFDLTTIFNDSLVAVKPELAVTVVANHDTQPLQALEAPVDPWFKPLAYALLLLRESGYPCVFYTDLYSAKYTDKGRMARTMRLICRRWKTLKS